MPQVNIDLLEGRTEQDLHLIGDSVHQAIVEELVCRSETYVKLRCTRVLAESFLRATLGC